MKARVKATGEIVEVRGIYTPTIRTFGMEKIDSYDLEGVEVIAGPDYWTKLEHQYAGMAMQGLMSYVEQITPKEGRSFCDEIVGISVKVAHALVEKMKEERK